MCHVCTLFACFGCGQCGCFGSCEGASLWFEAAGLLQVCTLVYWNPWTCDLYGCCTDMVLAWDHPGAYFGPVSDASFAGSCHLMLLCLSTTTGCQKKGTQCNYYSSAQPAQSFHVPRREYIFAILFLTMQLLAQTAARQEHRPVAKSTRPYNTRIYKATD